MTTPTPTDADRERIQARFDLVAAKIAENQRQYDAIDQNPATRSEAEWQQLDRLEIDYQMLTDWQQSIVGEARDIGYTIPEYVPPRMPTDEEDAAWNPLTGVS